MRATQANANSSLDCGLSGIDISDDGLELFVILLSYDASH
jgi:hypothetical protein